MKKRWLAIALAAVVIVAAVGMALVACTGNKVGDSISLLYDDRKNLSELLGVSVSNVEISEQQVQSFAVGTQTKDANVLIYENGTLYAVGTGTATLTVDGVAYPVTVKAAPISLFMITGHSVGAGQEGNGKQSVAVEAGQAYSSYHFNSLDTTKVDGYGLGYGSANRVGNSGIVRWDSYGDLDAFAAGVGGNTGPGSALAYKWNQLTGEKVWVINTAVPGSCINEWLPGAIGHSTTGYTYHYDTSVELFQYAQKILTNEIAAGHYTLSHMAIAYFNGVNFSAAGYSNWTLDSLKSDYTTMWNGFKEAFSCDMDGDGQKETVEALGIVPFWATSSNHMTYAYDKAATYYMAASQEWPDVFTLSDVYRSWAESAANLRTFPAIDYTTNSGTKVYVPTAVKNIAQDSAKGGQWSIFCAADNNHLSQVAYNALGMDMATNMYNYLCQDVDATSGSFKNTSGKDLDKATILVSQTLSIVPVIDKSCAKNVTLKAEGAVALNGNCIVGVSAGTGTVSLCIGDQVVDTIQVTVVG